MRIVSTGFTRSFQASAVAIALLALPATSGCIDLEGADINGYTDRQEKRFPVDAAAGIADVNLSTFDGSIEVRPWDRQEVLVVIERRAGSRPDLEDIRITASQTGNRINIEAKPDSKRSNFPFHYSRTAHLTVSLPASARLSARSGDGSIDLEGLTGAVDVWTGDGSVRGRELRGSVRARSGDGSIRFSDVSGTVTAETGDGSVDVSGDLTSLHVRTGDGRVVVRAGSGSSAAEDWSISTGDGSVSIELPRVFNADLDAHTGDGRIRTSLVRASSGSQLEDVERRDGDSDNNRHRREHEDTQSFRGRLGSGGSTVRVRTGDGSISVDQF